MGSGLCLAAGILLSFYLATYAAWAWRQGLRRGAIGIILVAAATVGLPAYLLWQNF